MFYPFFRNKFQFLALSFLIGLSIDAFLGTWGMNAFATTLIAYFRTLIFRTSTDTSTDFSLFSPCSGRSFYCFYFQVSFCISF
jgi:cell shape-determining protein MreD